MKETVVNTLEFIRLLSSFEQELIKEGKGEDCYCTRYKDKLMEFFSYVETNGITSITGITQKVANDYMWYLNNERINQNTGGRLEKSTIKLHRNAIHKFWKFLNAMEIQANTIWIKQRKVQHKEIVVLTTEEIQQLYSVCYDTGLGYLDRVIIATYYGCALRKGEGERLVMGDIDFNRNRIHVRKGKNGYERYVTMIPKVQRLVEEYVYYHRALYQGLANSDAFFISTEGTPYAEKVLSGRLKNLWKKVKERYGSDKTIHLHKLRHTLTTHLYKAKMDIEMIGFMLGHISPGTTQGYIHLNNLSQNGPI
ncbi:MAG: tyrosine-type recombinase/integrase [Bacteroidia bacterium]